MKLARLQELDADGSVQDVIPTVKEGLHTRPSYLRGNNYIQANSQ